MEVRVETATASARRQVEFTCKRCAHHAFADVIGRGHAGGGSARERASEDAVQDVARTIARARCPKCRLRAPGALLRFLVPHLALVAAIIAGGFVVGYAHPRLVPSMSEHDRAIAGLLWPIVAAATALVVVPIVAYAQWASTDRRVIWRQSQSVT